MTSAAVDVKYKGQEYVIKSIPYLKNRGINVKYILAGGGNPSRLIKIAKNYHVEKNVVFLGNLPHEKVFEFLTKADIYIQPSLQEGLPRSMIEAMRCGCFSMGARTAGIPELVQREFIFERKSSESIAKTIIDFLNLPGEIRVSKVREQYNKSQEYEFEILERRRNNYFSTILQKI